MAPTQQQTSVHIDSQSESSTDCINKPTELRVPVHMESDLGDSCSQNEKRNFQSTTKGMSARWGDHPSGLESLQDLRTAWNCNNKQNNLNISEDEHSHKVSLDVQGFREGDLKVKLVGENEIEVEGQVEMKNRSSTSFKNFKRRISLPPSVNVEAITSALSPDSVLTITVPKKETSTSSKLRCSSANISSNTCTQNQKDESLSGFSDLRKPSAKSHDPLKGKQETTNAAAASAFEDDDDLKEFERLEKMACGGLESVPSDGEQISAPCEEVNTSSSFRLFAKNTPKSSGSSENITKRVTGGSRTPSSQTSESDFSSNKHPWISSRSDIPSALPTDTNRNSTLTSDTAGNTCSQAATSTAAKNTSSVPPFANEFSLPLTMRGSLFDDDFFARSRQDFQEATRGVFGKWNQGISSDTEDFPYGKLKEPSFDDTYLENSDESMKILEEDNFSKIVLDVQGFAVSDLKVKSIGEKELQIDGEAETKDGASVSKKSFRRRVSLSSPFSIESVTCALSPDGVLTVTVPKKEEPASDSRITVNKVTSSPSPLSCGAQNSSVHFTSKKEETPCFPKVPLDSRFFTETKDSDPLPNPMYPLSSEVLRQADDRSQRETFEDSFFENSRRRFQAAMDETEKWMKETDPWLSKSPSWFQETPENGRKQPLRENSKSMSEKSYGNKAVHSSGLEEHRVASVSETKDRYQIVLDVRGCKEGSLKLRSVGENDLEAEGSIEDTKDFSAAEKGFKHQFHLPGPLNIEGASSVLSADGFLTIHVPKMKA